MHQAWEYESERHIAAAKEAYSKISLAESGSELRSAWEDYLYSYHRAIGRMISFSLDDQRSKPWGHRLKNASSKNDPGLMFLRACRAHAEHGLTPFAKFSNPGVNIGRNAIRLEGTNHVSISNSFIDGTPIKNLSLKTHKGKITSLEGETKVSIVETKAEVKLVPIYSDEKRKTYEVPTSINGKLLPNDDPASLAKMSLEVIDELFIELKEKLNAN